MRLHFLLSLALLSSQAIAGEKTPTAPLVYEIPAYFDHWVPPRWQQDHSDDPRAQRWKSNTVLWINSARLVFFEMKGEGKITIDDRLNIANTLHRTNHRYDTTSSYVEVDAFLQNTAPEVEAHLNRLRKLFREGGIAVFVGDEGANPIANWTFPDIGEYILEQHAIPLKAELCDLSICASIATVPLTSQEYDTLRKYQNFRGSPVYYDKLGSRMMLRFQNPKKSNTPFKMVYSEIFFKETGQTSLAFGDFKYEKLMPRHTLSEYQAMKYYEP